MPQFSPMQFIDNQAVGMVVGAVLNSINRRPLPKLQSGDNNYIPQIYWYATVIPMSAITQEAYQFRAEVTEQAVESNAVLSDHIILRPLQLEVEFEISNADGLGSDAQLARWGFEQAIAVWQSRQPFTLQTTHKLLPNMVCLSLSPLNEAPQWGALKFHATFKQISYYALQTQLFPVGTTYGDSVANQAPPSVSTPKGPANGLSAQAPAPKAVAQVQQTTTPFVPQMLSSHSSTPFGFSNFNGASR